MILWQALLFLPLGTPKHNGSLRLIRGDETRLYAGNSENPVVLAVRQ
jgi:hypothetical protein